jgi:PiT family inorganic phosphate transporter
VATDPALLVLVGLALAFTFLNGYNDSASIVATMVASRALTPRRALTMAAVAEVVGPFLLGSAVASTIGQSIVAPPARTPTVLIAALSGAGVWGIASGRFGIPTSATHALVGGLIGAGLIATGPAGIDWFGVQAVVGALAIAPALGLVGGFLYMKAMLKVGAHLTPGVNPFLSRLQVVTSVLVALSHGANDAQKGMGLITAGLLATGAQSQFDVPVWVVGACAAAIALGVAFGGQRTVRTLGVRIFTIRPIHGFAAQATAAGIVLGASALGGPASTTQIATSAIFGVGAAERFSKVRWQVGDAIVAAWLLTIPIAGLVAGGAYLILSAATS